MTIPGAPGGSANRKADPPANERSHAVKRFYDSFGWKKDESTGWYLGEILHEDLDQTAQNYTRSNEARYRGYLPGGTFFLDTGSGCEPRRLMSTNFRIHVCVDFSIVGLKESRDIVGKSGQYVLADLAALPFKDKTFDGVLASHCLYHIDLESQPEVLRQLYRVTNTDRDVVAFYSSRHNLISVAHVLAQALKGVGAALAQALETPAIVSARLGRRGANPLLLQI